LCSHQFVRLAPVGIFPAAMTIHHRTDYIIISFKMPSVSVKDAAFYASTPLGRTLLGSPSQVPFDSR